MPELSNPPLDPTLASKSMIHTDTAPLTTSGLAVVFTEEVCQGMGFEAGDRVAGSVLGDDGSGIERWVWGREIGGRGGGGVVGLLLGWRTGVVGVGASLKGPRWLSWMTGLIGVPRAWG